LPAPRRSRLLAGGRQGGEPVGVADLERDDLPEAVAQRLGDGEPVHAVLLRGPRLVQLGQHLFDGSRLGVAGRLPCGRFGGVGGAEVGAVPGEDGDPLLAGVRRICGDQVGGVGGAAAGHPDVCRCGAGVLADHHVGGGDGVALHTVRG
jgi:hypothetical protein